MEGLESFFTSGQQLNLFLISCAFGFPIGVIYDVFRVIRIMFIHGKIAVLIEDIIFFMIYGVFIMSFTITAARSEFRFYYIFGNMLGFVLYFVTLGNIITKFLKMIIQAVKKLIKRPAKKIALICEKIFRNFVRSCQNIKSGKKTLD